MDSDLIKLSVTLFATGVFVEGLALLFQGIAFSTPYGLGAGLFSPTPRSVVLGSTYVLSGSIQVLLATYFFMKLLRLPISSYVQFLGRRESVIIIDTALALLYLAGVEEAFRLNISGCIGLLIAAAIFTLILHPKLMRKAGMETDEVIKQSLILSGSVLLAFGGFLSNSVIALVHVGLISIPIFIYSLTSLVKLVGLTSLHKEVRLFSSLIIEVFIALSVLVGGGTNISGIYLLGLNAAATYSAGLYLVSGVLGIITGILLLIVLLTLYVRGTILKLRGEVSANPPMQI